MIQQIASYIVLVMSTIVTVLNKLLEYQAIYYSTKNRMNGDGIDIHSGFFSSMDIVLYNYIKTFLIIECLISKRFHRSFFHLDTIFYIITIIYLQFLQIEHTPLPE